MGGGILSLVKVSILTCLTKDYTGSQQKAKVSKVCFHSLTSMKILF